METCQPQAPIISQDLVYRKPLTVLCYCCQHFVLGWAVSMTDLFQLVIALFYVSDDVCSLLAVNTVYTHRY